MRSRAGWAAVFVLAAGLAVPGCRPGAKDIVLQRFSCDSREGVIQPAGVTVDTGRKTEGRASLRFSIAEPEVIRLFEAGDIDVEDSLLVYQARLRIENFQGRAYLEMWCHFEDKGEFFSRGLDKTLSGTTSWTRLEIPFSLKSGENPDNVKLNIVCEGAGTVWVDDVRLIKRTV